MPGYLTKQETITVDGVADLQIRSLLDQQQFADPAGAAEQLGISSAAWPLFGLLWPSGAHLAAQMAARLQARPSRPTGRILEIGCGLALASLVAHRWGADVTASDLHPLAGAFLQENLRLNRLPPMKYHAGAWSDRAALGPFDLIIGSDVLYERDETGLLAACIAHHAAPAAEVWIVDPDRGNRPAFNRHMAAFGFSRQETPLRRAALAIPADLRAYKGRLLVYQRAEAGTPHAGSR